MARQKRAQLGGLPPSYSFMLNPYPERRLSRCPRCKQKTGQRKIPLLIHIDPLHLLALNYTCRYCQGCDLLMAHKPAIEHLLAESFRVRDPNAIGNPYWIIGTVEKSTWRQGLAQPKSIDELLSHTSDFATVYAELRLTRPGWYGSDQTPPIMEPPASAEWVKSR